MKLETSRYNQGLMPEIVMTCTVEHEVAFKPEDIVKMLFEIGSDDMAKIINEIGYIFNKQELDQCYSVEDLDQEGRDFIEKMAYFIKENNA